MSSLIILQNISILIEDENTLISTVFIKFITNLFNIKMCFLLMG